ncbi:hypothetical protein D8I35_11295 [Corticibacter populi]|uniref:Uncharacterized protein n=1 Tax=Corticibacter populi TaxID=1550736 RepID=A0A3M6QRU2_9BURK|nr:hypothetical protein D8I35_11295 [Corticibacter populi]
MEIVAAGVVAVLKAAALKVVVLAAAVAARVAVAAGPVAPATLQVADAAMHLLAVVVRNKRWV